MKPVVERSTIPGVCEVWTIAGRQTEPGAAPALLIETPHGATQREHYEALRRRLRGQLPEDLEAFFFVNTDVGSFEVAQKTAIAITEQQPSRRVVVLRCLIPRTFIDCNRVVDPATGQDAPTPAFPDYIRGDDDRELLRRLHGRYLEVAGDLYGAVCGAGGLAVALHTYAPISVSVDRLDDSIVEMLRAAYGPERYASWPRRPAVDVISELSDGTPVAPRRLVDTLKDRYAGIGVEATENATYRLHPATLGCIHSMRYPEQVLCVELNRELLADPFSPFEEMNIGEEKTDRMAAPLVEALLS